MYKRTYNFKYYSTDKLKLILDSGGYMTDEHGHDYCNHIDEIREVYYNRVNKQVESIEYKEDEQGRRL